MMAKTDREEINEQAGHCHELSKEILGLDWYDTEHQARTVIEAMAKREVEEADKARKERP